MVKTLILASLICLAGCDASIRINNSEASYKYNIGDVVRSKTNTNLIGMVIEQHDWKTGQPEYTIRFSIPVVNDWNSGAKVFTAQVLYEFEIEKL